MTVITSPRFCRLPLVLAMSAMAAIPLNAYSAAQPIASKVIHTANPQHQEKISRWMWQANTSIRRERLTSPAASNAVYFYQRILSLAPNYEPAIKGLANLPQEYIKLAHKAYNLGDYAKVRRVLNRVVKVYGQEVLPKERQALEMQLAAVAPHLARVLQSKPSMARQQTVKSVARPALVKAAFKKEVNKGVEPATAKSAPNVKSKPSLLKRLFSRDLSAQKAPESYAGVSIKKAITEDKSVAMVVPSAPSEQKTPRETPKNIAAPSNSKPRVTELLDRVPPSKIEKRWMSQAQRLVEQRQFWQAEEVLKRALTSTGVTDNTRLMLLDVLAKQAKWPQYQSVLLSLKSTPLSARSVLRAKMLLKIQQSDYAVVELANNPPAIAQHLDYYAVWALALQKSKRYKEAQQKYLALLEWAPHNPRHWLGLGIAYIGAGQTDKSCQAMNQVVKASVTSQTYLLDNRVNHYVRDHLDRYCRSNKP